MMPLSLQPRWIKAEGTSTGTALLPNPSRIYEFGSVKQSYLNSIVRKAGVLGEPLMWQPGSWPRIPS